MLIISSAHAVLVSVGSGEPAATVVPHAADSAVAAASERYALVLCQSWFGGCRTLAFAMNQYVIASPKSCLLIVLSQSNVAIGLFAGSNAGDLQPPASIHACRSARLLPYHARSVRSAAGVRPSCWQAVCCTAGASGWGGLIAASGETGLPSPQAAIRRRSEKCLFDIVSLSLA